MGYMKPLMQRLPSRRLLRQKKMKAAALAGEIEELLRYPALSPVLLKVNGGDSDFSSASDSLGTLAEVLRQSGRVLDDISQSN
jgi:hypothetical protein